MPPVQQIYFDDKPLILTPSIEAYRQQHPLSAAYLSLPEATAGSLNRAKKYLREEGGTGVLLAYKDSAALSSLLQSCFTPITAAGGIVTSPENKTLMIYRRGKWDLPKGKLEEGEDIETCALREVREETGLSGALKAAGKSDITYHTYRQGDADILKTTHWFLMQAGQEEPLTPQTEEGISRAVWATEKDIRQYLSQSWATIKEVLTLAKGLSY